MTRSSLHAPERVLDPAALQGMDERWADLLRQRDELLVALKALRALVIGECGASVYECVDGERADAAIARAEGR